MNRPFANNVTIVTGASRGIGKALAHQLADQGARLVLAARSPDALEGVAEACRALGNGTRAIAVPTDVTSEDACRRLVEATMEEFGRVDTLINNAGLSMFARFDQLDSMEPIETLMQVNYFGSVYCTHYALPHLVETRGRIVGVASLTGKTGVPTRTGYAATKHAMAGFFDSLRIELRRRDVSVTMVYPGFVDTGIRHLATGRGRGYKHGRKAGKIMSAEECARITLAAAARRKREVVMTFRAKWGQWLKLIAPGVIDRIAASAVGDEE